MRFNVKGYLELEGDHRSTYKRHMKVDDVLKDKGINGINILKKHVVDCVVRYNLSL